jgi:tRNA nucleotidyltransferase/poly(A) polymerase
MQPPEPDKQLRRVPNDYDVATNATPPDIRRLFGRRRTLPIGAAFGVITVLGRAGAGQIEVATFRRDAAYSDGRHPDSVVYSTAEQDALRRDFTINGLFFDPIEQRVIDFVGGREDIKKQVVRAIGDPKKRFAEDKLRLLRAVRFAAAFAFTLAPDTLRTIREMAGEVTVVSAERIAAEMRRMLTGSGRTVAVRLLLETGLAAAVLPEIVPEDDAALVRLEHALAVLGRLSRPNFPLALATLLHTCVDSARSAEICRRWRLSNHETDRLGWLLAQRGSLAHAREMRHSALQRILVASGAADLTAWEEAVVMVDAGEVDARKADDLAYCRALLDQPRETLDPPPLLGGDDLGEHGIAPGPVYRDLLRQVRDAQLDGAIHTKDEALAMVDRLMKRE